MNELALLFHSEVRADVLKQLFGAVNHRRYRAEIIAQTDYAPASVEEELQKLVDLKLLTTSRDGNRRYYTANLEHPFYRELQAIVLKFTGQHRVRRSESKVPAPRPPSAAEPPASRRPKVVDESEPSPETEMYLR